MTDICLSLMACCQGSHVPRIERNGVLLVFFPKKSEFCTGYPNTDCTYLYINKPL